MPKPPTYLQVPPYMSSTDINSIHIPTSKTSESVTTDCHTRNESSIEKFACFDVRNSQKESKSTKLAEKHRCKRIAKLRQKQLLNCNSTNQTDSHSTQVHTSKHSHLQQQAKNQAFKNVFPFLIPRHSDNIQPSLLEHITQSRSLDRTMLGEFIRCFDRDSFFAHVNCNYLTHTQSEMSQKSRALLVNWLLLVHQKFAFRNQTFLLAVNILDLFCSRVALPSKQFQLLAVTVFFIAAKFEEVKPPKLSKLLFVSENIFTSDEVIGFEAVILDVIGYKLSTNSPLQLLEIKAARKGLDSATCQTAAWFLIATCFDLRMYEFGCEQIVDSCLLMAECVSNNFENDVGSVIADLGSRFGSHLISAGEKGSLCMKYMSLIVLNLERAGLLAIRKMFPLARVNCPKTDSAAN